MAQSLRKEVFNGLIWSFVERFSGQIIGFVAIVVMSRLLSQAEYGLVGMIMIFIDIAQGLVDSGVSQALIRKQDRNAVDSSTAFYFNLAISVALYLILYFSAPLIASFYGQPELIPLVRVVSLSILINAFVVVQKALLSVNIDFKTQTKASVSGAVISGIVGISLAATGFGVWSIVAYQLSNFLVTGILIWYYSAWRPIWSFSFASFKSMYRFGINLTLAGILNTIYKDLYLVIIGKIYKASALGAYTRAHQFAALPSSNINNIIIRVAYPVLCRYQSDREQLADKFMHLIRLTAFAVIPMMTGLAVLATPLVEALMGEKWHLAGTLLTIMSFSLMWIPMDSLNVTMLQVLGRTDLFLRIEVIKKVIGIAIIAGSVPFGLYAICCGQVLCQIIVLAIDCYYTWKYLHYGFWRQIKAISSTIFYTIVMAVVIMLSTYWIEGDWLRVIIGTASGILCYVMCAYISRSNELKELRSLIHRDRRLNHSEITED